MPTAKELRDLSTDEIEEQIKTARKDIFGLRFQHATGELEEAIDRVQAALETLSNRLSAVLEAEVLCPAQGGTDTPEASSELGRRLRAVWTQLMGVEKHIGSVTARIQL